MARSLSRSGYYFFHACLCLSLLSVSLRVAKAAGNIDVLEPIVRISPVRGTLGGGAANVSGDYFGFSVALHQIRVPSSFEDALDSTRILVGAPKGTFPGGLNLTVLPGSTPESETGLVYDCPVRSGTCGRIGSGQGNDARLFDPDADEIVLNDIINPNDGNQLNVRELKSGQQMGATLISSGELFVACAPQFTISFLESDLRDVDRRRKIGRCFYSQRNLTGFREMRPCVPTTGVSGGGLNRCVAGTSAVVNQNDNQAFISLGAPGASNYRGQAFLYQVSDGSATGPIDQSLFGRSALLGRTNDVYETYSMITGNITGGALPDYITSVPRANGSDYKGLVLVRKNLFDVTDLDVSIRGTQLAEYFGYSLAAADLNGDGYDEIIVGAPIYSDSERNIQEIGRVYVFRNNGGNINDANPIILPGDGIARARFGSSVVNIGDVNDDGYEDIAVGAPYQELDNGNSGKVYIYYGSPSFTDPFPDQTILASDVALTTGQHQLRTFGWSLTSGVDVDNNQYLDLLVGAYESGTAVLFRTLSVARIEISVSSDLVNNMLPIDLNVPTASFNLRLCASFSGRGLTGSLETILNIDEVVEQGSTRRLLFDGDEVYSNPFTFDAANQQACQNIRVSILSKESLLAGDITTVRDLQIRFNMTQDPRMTPPGYNGNPIRISDFRETPILIVGGNDTYTVVPCVLSENGGCEPDLTVNQNNHTQGVEKREIETSQVDSVCNNASLNRCDLCIKAAPECSWCPVLEEGIDAIMEQLSAEGYVNYRCRGPLFPLNCTESVSPLDGTEQNPQSEIVKVEDRELSRFANETIITRVQPQNVSIKLRQGQTVKFNMTFISLRNTPLDVYFLTDVSASLQFSINALRQGINDIAQSLEEISTGFAIGFGSFVDKKILPFGQDSNLEYLDDFRNTTRCRVFDPDQCVPSYVYHHSISLTNDVSNFQNILPDVSILSRSLDSPESPLDALLQAALCTDVVGWRDDALKMVFVITDQSYKFAGDGRLAGIFTPNQGRCNLAKIPGTNEYEYTRGTEEDYVSVWQIRDALERSRIVPVFITQFDLRCAMFGDFVVCPDTRLQSEPYENLLQNFDLRNVRGQFRFFNSAPGQDPTATTQELNNIIKSAYSATVRQVAVNTPTNIDGYSISITPVEGCNRNDSESACQVDFDDTVTFEASVTLEDCSTARRLRHQLHGGPYDFTYIDVEPLCECTANRDVGTCNDAMDLMCIERCVNSNFDENTCRTCEPTRPILTLSSLPEGETLEETLERVANDELPAEPGVDTTFQYTFVDCAAVVGGYTYRYYILLRAGDMYALILDQEIEESTTVPPNVTVPATTVPSTTVTLPPTTIPATTVTVPPPQPPPPPGVQGLCSIVVWYSPVVESCEDICDIRGYEVRLYNPQSSHPNITNRVGANRTFYMVEEEKLPRSHETYVQVRVIHGTSRVGDWSEGISLGCEKPTVPEKPPRVHFELNGKVYLNNSVLPLTDIGEGTSALYCRTDKEECCGTLPNRFGQFYYPNGVQVPINARGQGFYRNRGSQLIRLNRREGITSPTGTYQCEIPNDDDETINIYINLTGN